MREIGSAITPLHVEITKSIDHKERGRGRGGILSKHPTPPALPHSCGQRWRKITEGVNKGRWLNIIYGRERALSIADSPPAEMLSYPPPPDLRLLILKRERAMTLEESERWMRAEDHARDRIHLVQHLPTDLKSKIFKTLVEQEMKAMERKGG